jgi:hypothetical protein
MMEVNLWDLENTSGEREEFWLLAIGAAREAAKLVGQQDQSVQQTGGLETGINVILTKTPGYSGLEGF